MTISGLVSYLLQTNSIRSFPKSQELFSGDFPSAKFLSKIIKNLGPFPKRDPASLIKIIIDDIPINPFVPMNSVLRKEACHLVRRAFEHVANIWPILFPPLIAMLLRVITGLSHEIKQLILHLRFSGHLHLRFGFSFCTFNTISLSELPLKVKLNLNHFLEWILNLRPKVSDSILTPDSRTSRVGCQ